MEQQGAEPNKTAYVFGRFRLLPQRQQLLRDGIPVRIGGRALDILTLLVRRSGEIVSKDELLAFGWPDTFVHESNLKVNVAALRRALADGSAGSCIATTAGRGYRFVVPVKVEATDHAPSPRFIPPQTGALPGPPVVIGREGEMPRLAAALGQARCVTIVGSGGVGKTTMALAVAHHVQADYPHGISFIDLSTVGDPQYAAAAIAAGIGARQRSEDTLPDVVDVLRDRRMLLILDNCEHLCATVTAIADRLLDALPALTLLATSREPLRTAAEQVHRLPALAAPSAAQAITAEEALGFGAVRLFVARTQERGRYVLSDAEAPLVAAICQRLDGIPLAIELAASKTLALGVPTVLAMLEQRFLHLSNAERAAPLRQQTLLAALDWSYRLLSEDEATLLRLLSVFAGRFRLADAVALAEVADFDTAQTIDALERLANRSIVCTDYRDRALNYRLLESTRAYAAERLADIAGQERAALRHAWHVATLLERAAEEWEWREKSDWMADHADRIGDLRKALSWSFGPTGDRMLGVRLTAAAIPLWNELSSVCEMQSRVERALLAARDIGDCPPDLTMTLIAARAQGMTFAQHLALGTESAWHECYTLGVERQSPKYQLYGLWGLSSHLVYIGRPLDALAWLHRFIALAEAQADWPAVAEGNRIMAVVELYTGRIASARQRLERLAPHQQQPKDPVRFARFQAERGVAIGCSHAFVLWISGEPGRAMQVARATIERAEATGHVVSHSNALAVCAIPIALWTGDLRSAAEFLAALEDNGRREDIGIWREVCRFFKAALRARRREAGAAADMKARLDDLIAARNLLRAPMHYSMVAEALLEAGATDDARAAIDEADALAQAQSAEWCRPEILRISGLIELKAGNAEEAGRLLRLGVAKAQAIGAVTLELGAALALSARLQADNHGRAAVDLLAAICSRFGEGDVSADLTEARRRLQAFGKAERKRAPARPVYARGQVPSQ